MSIELKVKAASLAFEAAYIHKHERRFLERWRRARQRSELFSTFDHLRSHRLSVVRPAARSTHLARAFIKGTPYRVVEMKSHSRPDVAAVEKMVRQYGQPEMRNIKPAERTARIRSWLSG